jgi:hypothetical protein
MPKVNTEVRLKRTESCGQAQCQDFQDTQALTLGAIAAADVPNI